MPAQVVQVSVNISSYSISQALIDLHPKLILYAFELRKVLLFCDSPSFTHILLKELASKKEMLRLILSGANVKAIVEVFCQGKKVLLIGWCRVDVLLISWYRQDIIIGRWWLVILLIDRWLLAILLIGRWWLVILLTEGNIRMPLFLASWKEQNIVQGGMGWERISNPLKVTRPSVQNDVLSPSRCFSIIRKNDSYLSDRWIKVLIAMPVSVVLKV